MTAETCNGNGKRQKAKADPYGMTTKEQATASNGKRQQGNSNGNQRRRRERRRLVNGFGGCDGFG
jgi:hypothetical protein